MKRKITLVIAAAALAGATLAAAALGATSSALTTHASKGVVVALGQTSLGSVLVNARGRTLYVFEKDKHGRSACYGACATYWPPLLTPAKPRAGKGLRAALLGISKRTDGKQQVTYARHPLYTFFADQKAGQTNGEGLTDFGAAWDAVAASGHAIEPTSSGSAGTGRYGGYGGYGH
jgi:predicted lipoprotein with Yx(FWY)xxD motif